MSGVDRGGPRVALIHALEESVAPAKAAFAACWPQARPFDLLDTSLAPDRAAGSSDRATRERIGALFDYTLQCGGADDPTAAVLFTCSAFAHAIAEVQARANIPVLTPNSAAFHEALTIGPRVAIAVTFEPSAEALLAEIHEIAQRLRVKVQPRAIVVPAALAALKQGRSEVHDRYIADVLADVRDVDSVVLGQFSMARAATVVRVRQKAAVITTPLAAAHALKKLHAVSEEIPLGDSR